MKLSDIPAAHQLSIDLRNQRELLDCFSSDQNVMHSCRENDPYEARQIRLVMEPKLRQRISLIEEKLRELGGSWIEPPQAQHNCRWPA